VSNEKQFTKLGDRRRLADQVYLFTILDSNGKAEEGVETKPKQKRVPCCRQKKIEKVPRESREGDGMGRQKESPW